MIFVLLLLATISFLGFSALTARAGWELIFSSDPELLATHVWATVLMGLCSVILLVAILIAYEEWRDRHRTEENTNLSDIRSAA